MPHKWSAERECNIISLGAGVQSSTMALMASHGELGPMPEYAIFADTQCEPPAVYEWLDYLRPLLAFPVVTVTAGNLGEDFLTSLASTGSHSGQPPFFAEHDDGSAGMSRRKCTTDYKVRPIRRKTREIAAGRRVSQWIGISYDELHRMKPSDVDYIKNEYPLVDLRITRDSCLKWMQEHGYKMPPKSACYFCPYMGKPALRAMRDNDPETWQRLVEYDKKMREVQERVPGGAGIKCKLYVHKSLKPIDEVDMRNDEERGILSLFGNECEGMCGV